MLSKKDIQLIRSLAVKKYRQKYNKYIAEGEKICLEILQYVPELVEVLYLLPEFHQRYASEIEKNKIQYELISSKELKKISQLKNPNQVVAVMKIPDAKPLSFDDENILLYLDDVRDPGNIGTLIRTADWFGLKKILLSKQCVDSFNPKVVQASMGSLFRVETHVVDLIEFLSSSSRNYHVYLAEMKGENAFNIEYQKPMILVLGNESHGVDKSLDGDRFVSVSIPKKTGKTESLNVAVAGSILIAEVTK